MAPPVCDAARGSCAARTRTDVPLKRARPASYPFRIQTPTPLAAQMHAMQDLAVHIQAMQAAVLGDLAASLRKQYGQKISGTDHQRKIRFLVRSPKDPPSC